MVKYDLQKKRSIQMIKDKFLKKGTIKGGYTRHYEHSGTTVLPMIYLKIKTLVICINMYIMIKIRPTEPYCSLV